MTVWGGEVLGRWWSHESTALINGVSALIKEAWESSLVPSTLWGHREKSASINQKALTMHRLGQCLDLGRPGFRTMRNKCLLIMKHAVKAFCNSSLSTKTSTCWIEGQDRTPRSGSAVGHGSSDSEQETSHRPARRCQLRSQDGQKPERPSKGSAEK